MSTENNGPLDGISLGDLIKIGTLVVGFVVGYTTLKNNSDRNAEMILEIKKDNEQQDVLITQMATKISKLDVDLAGITKDTSYISETLRELKPIIMDGLVK